MARKLEVEIVGDASSLNRALGGASKSFTGSIGAWVKGGLVLKGVSTGVDLLTTAIKGGIEEYAASAKVAAQTNAVLRSTGGAANVSAKHVDQLAASVSSYSGMDDEAVQSGENMLLTFTQIQNNVGKGNKIFDQATKTVADLSTALGEDMTTAAMQVGKALNDPLRGYARLQRIGVAFTKTQVEEIKALLDTGKTAKEVTADRVNAAKELSSAQGAQEQAEARVKSAQDAVRTSSEQLDKAQQHLADAHAAVKTANEGVAAASEKVKYANEGVAAAVGKVKDAAQGLKDAQQRELDAQKNLTQARKDATRQLLDMRDAAINAQLGERAATLSLARAQENLDKVMADPNSTLLDKQEAMLAVEEAQQNLTEAQRRTIEAEKANNKAQKDGVEGSKLVVDAKKQVADAHQAEIDATEKVKAAQQDLTHAYDDVRKAQLDLAHAADGVTKAQRDVRNAERDVNDATRKQHDAQKKLKDALNDQAAASAAVVKAQKDVKAAQEETAGGQEKMTNVIKAQKIILGELNKEFGGSAEAFGKTLPGQIAIAQEAFNNWSGRMVGDTIPTLTKVTDWLKTEWPGAVVYAKQAYEQYLKPLFDDLYIISSAVYNFIHDNWGTIGPIVEGVGKAVEAGLTLMVTPLKLIRDILTGDWSQLWQDFSSAPATFVKGVSAMFLPVGAAIKKAITAGLKGIGAEAWDWIKNIGDYIAGRIDVVISWGTRVGTAVKNAVVNGLVGIASDAWGIISNIGGFLHDQLDVIGGWGKAVGRGIVDALADVLRAEVSALKIGKGIANAIIRFINDNIIGRINSALKFDIPLPFGKSFTVDPKNIPDIPLLAAGGVVMRPTLAVVGESGPEAVVPLSSGSALGGSIEIHYHGTVISERNAARQIATLLARERGRGNPAFA